MKGTNNLNHSKEIRQKNLLALKGAIDSNCLNEIVEFDGEWGGAHVIITSSQDRIHDLKTDGDDWCGRSSECTYVLTRNSKDLSKLFAYVRDDIMEERDNYLYGFIALLANDLSGNSAMPMTAIPS